MSQFLNENKKSIRFAIIGFIIVIIMTVLSTIFLDRGPALNPTEKLEILGKQYYEAYLYPKIVYENSDYSAYLQNLSSTTGIKITLSEILKQYPKVAKTNFEDKKKKISCDFEGTYALIYPKAPYAATDYTITLTTECK